MMLILLKKRSNKFSSSPTQTFQLSKYYPSMQIPDFKKRTLLSTFSHSSRANHKNSIKKYKDEEDCFDNLRQTAAAIKDMKKEDIKEDELVRWFETDLIRLVKEAEDPSGDIRSKRIYESLDDWLKVVIRIMLRKKNFNAESREEMMIEKRSFQPGEIL